MADLRGRQSVRTTFKLSERSIDALSLLAGQLGIKQKSLFDHLVDDAQTLRLIAKEKNSLKHKEQRVAKTYVISRSTLESLERVSSRYKTPRDILVEFSIERIMPLIEQEKEKQRRRKALLSEVERYCTEGHHLLQQAERQLGEEDPVVVQLLSMMRAVQHSRDEVHDCVEKGKRIEDF